jgi:hypothetical protein
MALRFEAAPPSSNSLTCGLPDLTLEQQDSSALPLLIKCEVAIPEVALPATTGRSFVMFRVEVNAVWNHRPNATPAERKAVSSTCTVFRRYSDFEWLRAKLRTSVPCAFVPLLPSKVQRLLLLRMFPLVAPFSFNVLVSQMGLLSVMSTSAKKAERLRARQLCLEFWLCEVVRHRLLMRSPFLHPFLTSQEEYACCCCMLAVCYVAFAMFGLFVCLCALGVQRVQAADTVARARRPHFLVACRRDRSATPCSRQQS